LPAATALGFLEAPNRARLVDAPVALLGYGIVSLLCDQADLALKSLELLQIFEQDGPDAPKALDAIKQVERHGEAIRRVQAEAR
jgi:hypothetical protein